MIRTRVAVLFFMFNFSAVYAGEAIDHDESGVSGKDIYLDSIAFAEAAGLEKVQRECDMLGVMRSSILESASSYHLALKDSGDSGALSENEVRVSVEYLTVVAHRWTPMSFRPSSTATFRVSLFEGGKLLGSSTKSIGSGVALGACDRLEKISLAAGRYVSKWVSQQM